MTRIEPLALLIALTPAAPYAVGDRVRTLIDLDSADWDPEQPDIPAGALGTITSLPTALSTSYGVLLDDDVHRLAVALDPHEIERAK